MTPPLPKLGRVETIDGDYYSMEEVHDKELAIAARLEDAINNKNWGMVIDIIADLRPKAVTREQSSLNGGKK